MKNIILIIPFDIMKYFLFFIIFFAMISCRPWLIPVKQFEARFPETKKFCKECAQEWLKNHKDGIYKFRVDVICRNPMSNASCYKKVGFRMVTNFIFLDIWNPNTSWTTENAYDIREYHVTQGFESIDTVDQYGNVIKESANYTIPMKKAESEFMEECPAAIKKYKNIIPLKSKLNK